jgi:hypothetical protein
MEGGVVLEAVTMEITAPSGVTPCGLIDDTDDQFTAELMHHGMSQMPLFGMTYRSQPSKKKLLASAPSTALD